MILDDLFWFLISCGIWNLVYGVTVERLKICTQRGYYSLDWRREYATYVLSTLHAMGCATPYALYRYSQGRQLYEYTRPNDYFYLGVYSCAGASYFLVDMLIMYGPMKAQTKPKERLVFTIHHSLSILLIAYCYYHTQAWEWHLTKTALLACEFPVLFLNIYHHLRMTAISVPADPESEDAAWCPTFLCLVMGAINSVCMIAGYVLFRLYFLAQAMISDVHEGLAGSFGWLLGLVWVMQLFFTCELTKRGVKSVLRAVNYWYQN